MNKKNKDLIDLHLHTDASDGTWSMKETLAMVIEKNIKYFSITDHDTFENSLKALKYIPRNKKFIIGAEISSTYKGKEYHILAYGFDPNNEELNELINHNRLIREKYNDDLVGYVKKYELINDVSDYMEYKSNPKRGGWKSLNYLIDKGLINDLDSYFNLVQISKLALEFKSPEVVIERIHAANGYCILAHPSGYGENLMNQVSLNQWLDFGIDGIECFSPYLDNLENAKYYTKFCEKNELMISGGSDCHGKFNERAIGVPAVTWNDTTLEMIFGNM